MLITDVLHQYGDYLALFDLIGLAIVVIYVVRLSRNMNDHRRIIERIVADLKLIEEKALRQQDIIELMTTVQRNTILLEHISQTFMTLLNLPHRKPSDPAETPAVQDQAETPSSVPPSTSKPPATDPPSPPTAANRLPA